MIRYTKTHSLTIGTIQKLYMCFNITSEQNTTGVNCRRLTLDTMVGQATDTVDQSNYLPETCNTGFSTDDTDYTRVGSENPCVVTMYATHICDKRLLRFHQKVKKPHDT